MYIKRKQESNMDVLQMHTLHDNDFDTDTEIFISKKLEQKFPSHFISNEI